MQEEPAKTCRILALDGGGAKGFCKLGVFTQLDALLGGEPLATKFDLIVGTSTGAMIWTASEVRRSHSGYDFLQSPKRLLFRVAGRPPIKETKRAKSPALRALEQRRTMVAPLTKKNAQGIGYARPPEVEAEIDEVALLSHEALKKRLAIRSPRKIGFLRPETLVHVIRKGAAATSNDIVNAALMVLLKRCERNLKQKVADLPTAEGLREDVLGEFAEMLASNGRGEIPDELDYYECRFNSAFRTLRVDRVNQELARLERFNPVESVEEVEELFNDPRLVNEYTASLQDHQTPEARARMQQLLAAIEALPKKEREAVVLVHIMGLKEESEDPHEDTAAKRCGCTGRTIRNRLTSAEAKLARFQEDQ